MMVFFVSDGEIDFVGPSSGLFRLSARYEQYRAVDPVINYLTLHNFGFIQH